jgi:hypothetical protein
VKAIQLYFIFKLILLFNSLNLYFYLLFTIINSNFAKLVYLNIQLYLLSLFCSVFNILYIFINFILFNINIKYLIFVSINFYNFN